MGLQTPTKSIFAYNSTLLFSGETSACLALLHMCVYIAGTCHRAVIFSAPGKW